MSGTWTLTRTGTYPWIQSYSSFTVVLIQTGSTLTGTLQPAGQAAPSPIVMGSVSSSGAVSFGTEGPYAYWNDSSDAYFYLTLDSSGNRMTGSCAATTCTAATAVRVTSSPPPASGASSFAATIAGARWSAPHVFGSGAIVAGFGQLTVQGSDLTVPGRILTFSLSVTGPGTYTVGPDIIYAGYQELNSATASAPFWTADKSGGSGTVTVTTMTNSGASGTFSFTMVPGALSSASGTKVIADGVFNVTF